MASLNLPIVLVNGLDLILFASLEGAQRFVEPVDVENQEYIGFDAMGRPLRLDVTLGEVAISPSAEPPDPGALRELLIRCLTAAGEEPLKVQPKGIADLLSIARKRCNEIP